MFIGLAMSAVLIGLFAVRLDWKEFRSAIAGVSWPWVVAACFAICASITLRAARWAAIGAGNSVFPKYWSATVVGYLGNVLYPGRAGELLRVAALHKAAALPPGQILATAVLDRMSDVIALGFIALYVMVASAAIIASNTAVTTVILLILAPAAGFVVVLALGGRFKPWLVRFSARLPAPWAERIPRWYLQGLQACSALFSLNRLVPVTVLTVTAYCVDWVFFMCLLRAFEWSLPLIAAMTVGVLLAIGSLVPAAPGYVGIYQVACVIALAPYGVRESAALAYSLVAQGATVLVITTLGLAIAARYGMRYISVKDGG